MSELKISPELLQISPEVQDALKNKKTGCCAGIDHNFSRNAIPTKCPNRN
nr:pseudouridine-5-phosphate glycosidase [Escherichia coli]EFE4083373.1 pseudouridine-5-phosphate glycosidase [Escherichia coli]